MLDFGLSHGDLEKLTGSDLMEGKMTPLILTHQSLAKIKKATVEHIPKPHTTSPRILKTIMMNYIEAQCLAFAEPLRLLPSSNSKACPTPTHPINARRLLEKL